MPDTLYVQSGDPHLRPLLRLCQLAVEVQRAASRGETEMMSQAAALLAPALNDWAEARRYVNREDTHAAALCAETQRLLAASEQAVHKAMTQVQSRRGETRQHLRRVRSLRARRPARTGRMLDACR